MRVPGEILRTYGVFFYEVWLKQDLPQEVRRIHSTSTVDGVGKGETLGGGK